jgi:hypothetical protein
VVLVLQTLFSFLDKTSNLNEVNCTKPSVSASVLCYNR